MILGTACHTMSICGPSARSERALTGGGTPAETRRIISWIFAAHQMGGALAGIGAGAVRSFSGNYLLAFMTSGLTCLLASLLVLRIRGLAPAIVPAV